MSASPPQTERHATGDPQTAVDASIQESLALPHQRDQQVPMTSNEVDPRMVQAHTDLAQGKQDTSRAVESDRAYHAIRPGQP